MQGELVRPQGSLVLERKRAQFNSMIKLRTDFDDEIDFAEEIASRRVLFRLVLFKLPVLEKPQVPLILTRKQTP